MTWLAVRAVRPYRSFPSIDDFAYVPLAWAWRDGSLFPRDTLARTFVHHTPAWDIIVLVLDRTIGESLGFWLLTLLLTLATLGAVARLLRATGASPLLLPVVAAVAFCGPVIGFGRGASDGALGDAFHVQWLSICALLWSYDAFVRGRAGVSGAWLGLAALCHPVVAAHGAVAIAAASMLGGSGAWKRLPLLAGVTLLVSLPLSLPLLRSLGSANSPAGAMSADVIKLGYEFRAPQHYLPWLTPPSTWWYLVVMVLAGLAAAAVPRPAAAPGATRRLAGLLAGQALLALASALLYGSWMPERWRYASSLPYLLDLSRTSGLLLPLAAVLIAGALELRPSRRAAATPTHELLWAGLLAAAATALLLFVGWRLPLALLVAVTIGARVAGTEGRARWVLAAGLLLVVIVGVHRLRVDTQLEAPLTAEESGLYHWASATSPRALFIIPPGLQAFRFYARRSVYVDFKLFPPATPSTTPEWRRRMELVAAPDRRALDSPGWSGVPQWDRTYANRNTPERIVTLLRQTGADYLVWDRTGLDLPPYVPIVRPPAPAATVVFENARFQVYGLADAGR
jgi:hypothetical protein